MTANSQISHYPGDFYKDLAVWSNAFIEKSNRIRHLEERIRSIEREDVWMEEKIESLKLKLSRKPSTIREINQWRYSKRKALIELAFYCDELNKLKGIR